MGGRPLPCDARNAEVCVGRGAGAGEGARTGLCDGVRLGVLLVLACLEDAAEAAAAAAFLLAFADANAADFALRAAMRSRSSSSVSLDKTSESMSIPPVVKLFFFLSIRGLLAAKEFGAGAAAGARFEADEEDEREG